MIVLDKIRAFFKWYRKGMGFLEELKPEAKDAEKKAAEPPETEAPEKKGDESSSK